MKDLLLGLGIGFLVGAIAVRTSRPLAEKIQQGVEKGKEIMNNSGEKAKYATKNIFLEFDLKNKFMTAFHF